MDSRVRVEVSARHCHLSRRDLAALYGRGYRPRKLRPISQRGQYAAKETVLAHIGNGALTLRIVGPERPRTQVEISLTQARALRVRPPVTHFGNPSARRVPCRLTGPRGSVRRSAVIVAQRHLHCDPATAKRLGLRAGQLVSVRTFGTRAVTFHRVVVRVHPSFRFRLHLDTDEANAAGLKGGEWGVIVTKEESRIKN